MQRQVNSRRRRIIEILLFVLWSSAFVLGCQSNPEPVDRNKQVDLQGHRGARAHRPENTIPAFQYCMDEKMDTIELDTVVTKDKRLIVYHDTKLNGELCLDEKGNPAKPIPIKTLTVTELKSYDCGTLQNEEFPQQQPFPKTRLSTLPEVFDYVKHYESQKGVTGQFRYNIELKYPEEYTYNEVEEGAQLLVKAIEAAALTDRVTVQCFVMEMLPLVKKLNPILPTSALFEPTIPQGIKLIIGFKANSDEILQKTIDAGADYISPYYLYIKPDFVRTAHANQIKVLPWIVNDEESIVEMLNLNVDGIISDDPDLLYSTYQRWKQQ